ncbi:hypothetical protein C4K39_1837 [Pseudomonas sessilinigenes]|nr:hypothetical protein C4K39_1837 [Pseudomonas sessilinigenes]
MILNRAAPQPSFFIESTLPLTIKIKVCVDDPPLDGLDSIVFVPSYSTERYPNRVRLSSLE